MLFITSSAKVPSPSDACLAMNGFSQSTFFMVLTTSDLLGQFRLSLLTSAVSLRVQGFNSSGVKPLLFVGQF